MDRPFVIYETHKLSSNMITRHVPECMPGTCLIWGTLGIKTEPSEENTVPVFGLWDANAEYAADGWARYIMTNQVMRSIRCRS